MTKKLVGVAGAVAVCLMGVASAQPGRAMPPVPTTPDLAVLAEKLVGTNANVKEGQVVMISAGPLDTALAEELAVAVRKRGAHPIITYWSESLARKTIAGTPDKFDGQARKLDMALAKIVDVTISIPQVRDPSIYAAVPAARAVVIGKAEQPAEQLRRKRNVKMVDLGNGLAPTAMRAKELGLSEADLKKIYWDGITADYAAVEQKCTALKATLAKGKELKITHANGTDLTLAIKGKKISVSDGVISDADIKAGGPGVQAWLPAGEVYLPAGIANGKLVDDRFIAIGKDTVGLTIEVKAGKITSMTAKSGWDGVVKDRFDAAGPGKNELSLVDFGCNPAVKGDKLENYIPAGMLTIGFGGNDWAGGTNKEPFGLQLHLPGTTVMLDGKAIIENGQLK